MKKIIALIAAMVFTLATFGVSPAIAEEPDAPAVAAETEPDPGTTGYFSPSGDFVESPDYTTQEGGYTCRHNLTKVSTNTKDWTFLAPNNKDRFQTMVTYSHCTSLTNYYDKLGGMQLKVRRLEGKTCLNGGLDQFVVNPTPLDGFNTAGLDQDCVSGQEYYLKYVPLNRTLYASEDDRCFDHNWKIRLQTWNDLEGNSVNRCFA